MTYNHPSFLRGEDRSGALWGPMAVVFVGSILITFVFWMMLPGSFGVNESSDYARFYEPVARNILEGRGVTLNDVPATRYPPGHPMFLAGLFKVAEISDLREGSVLATAILICTGLSSVFLFLLARQIWGMLPALLSTLIWITYPLALWLTKQPNSEVPFLVFFYGSCALFVSALFRNRHAGIVLFISGLSLGIAMLIRPIALAVGLIFGLIILLMKRDVTIRMRTTFVAILLLGNFVAVLPWEAWVYSKTGKVILLTGAGTPNMDDGLMFAILGDKPPSGAPDDVIQMMQAMAARGEQMRSIPGIVGVIGDEFQKQPLTTMKLLAIKAARSWYGTDSRRFDLAASVLQAPYLVLALWGTWRGWRKGRVMRGSTIGIWMVVLYFWAMTFVALPLVRYMVPVFGLLFLLIPAGFDSLRRRGRFANLNHALI